MSPPAGDDFVTPVDYLWAVVELPDFHEVHCRVRGQLETNRAGLTLGERGRADRLATSKHSRARREADGIITRRSTASSRPTFAGFRTGSMTCEPNSIGSLLADLRGADELLPKRVPAERLMSLVARRLRGDALPDRDRTYLRRCLDALNPSRPVEIRAAGALESPRSHTPVQLVRRSRHW